MSATITTAVDACRRGHPRTPENIMIGSDGARRCRACRRETQAWKTRTRNRHPREVLLYVPVEPLRNRFLELQALGRATPNSVAMALGWTFPRPGRDAPLGDGSRLRKRLGIVGGATTIRYETAVAIAAALGMEPYEAGV